MSVGSDLKPVTVVVSFDSRVVNVQRLARVAKRALESGAGRRAPVMVVYEKEQLILALPAAPPPMRMSY